MNNQIVFITSIKWTITIKSNWLPVIESCEKKLRKKATKVQTNANKKVHALHFYYLLWTKSSKVQKNIKKSKLGFKDWVFTVLKCIGWLPVGNEIFEKMENNEILLQKLLQRAAIPINVNTGKRTEL